MRFLNVLVSAFLLASLLAPSVKAQDGVMNSIALAAYPQGAPIAVEPLDNSDQNLVLQRDFERALADQGIETKAGASLVLTFETRDEIGAWSTIDRRHILSFESQGGRGGGENAKARVNAFDSNTGGLLNRGNSGTRIATPSQYRIDAFLEDRASGKRYWQGWTIGNLAAGDGLTLSRKMVPLLVENIGETVRQRSFELY